VVLGHSAVAGRVSDKVVDIALGFQTLGLLEGAPSLAFIIATALMSLLLLVVVFKPLVVSFMRSSHRASLPVAFWVALKLLSRLLVTVCVVPLARVMSLVLFCWGHKCSGLLCLSDEDVRTTPYPFAPLFS